MKKSKDVYGAAGQTNLLLFEPEALEIVTDPSDPLYDKRVEDALDEAFILNIKTHGVQQPIAVWKDPESGTTKVVFGRRRTRACIEANKLRKKEGLPLLQIPAVVKRGDAKAMTAIMVIENEQREDDTPLRRAEKMVRLSGLGFSEDDIGNIFGLTKQQVKRTMRLLEQPAVVQNAVESGRITLKLAFDLAQYEPEEQRQKLKDALEAGEGKTGHAKSRSMRKAAGAKPVMRSRGEISIRAKRVNGEAAAVLEWVLGAEWPSAIPISEAAP